eukprot:2871128-Rhodomonas_salina.2
MPPRIMQSEMLCCEIKGKTSHSWYKLYRKRGVSTLNPGRATSTLQLKCSASLCSRQNSGRYSAETSPSSRVPGTNCAENAVCCASIRSGDHLGKPVYRGVCAPFGVCAAFALQVDVSLVLVYCAKRRTPSRRSKAWLADAAFRCTPWTDLILAMDHQCQWSHLTMATGLSANIAWEDRKELPPTSNATHRKG